MDKNLRWTLLAMAGMLLAAALLLAPKAHALEAVWDAPDPADNVTALTLYWQKGDGTGDVYNATDPDGVAPMALDENWFQPGVEYHFWATFFNSVGSSPNSEIANYTRPQPVGPPPDHMPTNIFIPPGSPVTINIQ